jgi:predicted amidohydrolase
VLVGAMLGTDFMFMGPARVLMVQGAELVLNPVAEANISSDRNTKFLNALTQDNILTYATANYIDTDPTGLPEKDRVKVMVVNVTAIRERRMTAGTWEGGMDFLSRKPFQYQPLCYDSARQAHANAGVTPVPAPNPGDGPVVTVAVLQMNSVAVLPEGADPVPAHIDRATKFVRAASKKLYWQHVWQAEVGGPI